LPRPILHWFIGVVSTNASASEPAGAAQNRALVRPAVIAPGTATTG
jgi:hypothetical protein